MGVYDNWVAHAEWENGGTPITKFTTTWTVSPAPSSPVKEVKGVEGGNRRTVFLFNALTYNETVQLTESMVGEVDRILQPVLAFGENPSITGTGEWWTIQSWLAGSQDTKDSFVHSLPPVKVFPGDVLTGEMEQINRSDGKCDLVSLFRDSAAKEIEHTRIEIKDRKITAKNVCQIALEVYNPTSPQSYPNTFRTAMVNNRIWAGDHELQPEWVVKEQNVQQWGERSVITNRKNPTAVDLCYGFAAPPSTTVISRKPGSFDAFAINTLGLLTHGHCEGGPTVWQTIDGALWTSPSTALSPSPGVIDVFGLGPGAETGDNRNVNQARWVRFAQGTAPLERYLGGDFSGNVGAISIADARIDIFGITVGGRMVHTRIADDVWNGSWTGVGERPHENPRLFMASPVPIESSPGKIKVFGLGVEKNILLEHDFTGEAGAGWIFVTSDMYSNPFVLKCGGRMILFSFVRDNRDRIQANYRLTDTDQDWRYNNDILPDLPFGGLPVAVSRDANSVDLFILDKEGKLRHRTGSVSEEQLEWKKWEQVPFDSNQVLTSVPTVVTSDQDTIEVFVRNAGNQLLKKTYLKGVWKDDENIGGEVGGF